MPQPPTDWTPIDDRVPADPHAAGLAYRSEGFAEDLEGATGAPFAAPAVVRRFGRGRWRLAGPAAGAQASARLSCE